MSANPHEHWATLGRETVFSAPPWVRVDREKIRLPSGREIPDFFRVVLPSFVVVVARTSDGRYPLVRGYKHGLGGETLSPPAGQIDAGEEPLAAAKRELLEETGYVAENWKFLGQCIVDGNRQCGTMHLFSASNATSSTAPKSDEMEILTVSLLTKAEVLEALKTGQFRTLPGAGGLAQALLLGDD